MVVDASAGLISNVTVGDQDDSPRICEPGGHGLILPLGGDAEIGWDVRFKVMLYGVGLIYCFLGVSIVADIFMAAIERITSEQKKVKLAGTNRMVTVLVWNETVANLTLMALGSSAPEILLALNDVLKNGFFEGNLGPSTIVGSAAFNLFCIIAVCINSIPNGEVRRIKETGVFAVTAIWSIFAYLWLLFIVQFNSTNVIELWEGVVTFCFFPIFVAHSWAQDAGLMTRENFAHFFFSCCCPSRGGEDKDEKGLNCCSVSLALLKWLVRTVAVVLKTLLLTPLTLFRCVRSMTRRVPLEALDEEKQHAVASDEPELQEILLDEDGDPIEAECGIMTFRYDERVVYGGPEERSYNVTVYRKNGDRGRVSVAYRTVGLTAVPGYDFVEDEGELVYRDGVLEQELEFTILPMVPGERNDSFQIVIEDESGQVMFNPWHDGGEERNILTVRIVNENPVAQTFGQKAYRSLDLIANVDELKLGWQNWKEQVLEAVYVNGSAEEQQEATVGNWISHLIWLPWKVPFAILVPPPTFLGGKVCFAASLVGIGGLTIIIGDLAELFGCALNINDAITAISIVAMGTSVPDLFASRTAAKADEYADASIVNVTGSNSVNVFLGIGLPWMVASAYWTFAGASAQWTHRYGSQFGSTWGRDGAAVFVVRSGQLFFSVCVFTLAACVCLTVLVIRRVVYGGELGGPPDPKAYSSFLLVVLWFAYIALSTWQLITNTSSFVAQLGAIGIAIPVVVGLMLLFALLVKTLKFSKRYIGEEGFWGVFVAACVIAARLAVYFAFQYQW